MITNVHRDGSAAAEHADTALTRRPPAFTGSARPADPADLGVIVA